LISQLGFLGLLFPPVPASPAQAPERAVLQEKGDSILAMAYSGNGRWLAWGGSQQRVHLWDLGKGKVDGVLEHPWKVYSVVFSPESRLLAVATAEQTPTYVGPIIVLWNVETRKEQHRLRRGGMTLAFSPDGKTLISGARRSGGTELRVWDVATGKERAELNGHKDFVSAVAYAPDGKTFASGSHDGTVIIWDAQTLKSKLTLAAFQGEIVSLAYSPDSTTLLAGSTTWAGLEQQKHTLKHYEVRTGKLRWEVKPSGHDMRGVQFLPDGKLVTFGASQDVVFLDARTGEYWAWMRSSDKKQGCWPVVLSPDGKTVVTGDSRGCVRVWDVPKEKMPINLLDD
jgi:WD40 repeat protein